MNLQIRPTTILWISLLALGVTALPRPAAAANWGWLRVPTSGNVDVRSLAVAPNNVPFVVSHGGTVYYLKRGNLGTSDKWIDLPGVSPWSLSADLDGTIWALDAHGIASQPSGVEDPNFRPVSGYGWAAARGWGSGCAMAMATSGVGPDLTEDFATPASRSWDRYSWVVGCDGNYDSSLWVIHRSQDATGAFHSSGWKNIASQQGATSAQVAVFTHYEPVGPVQDVWFQDSAVSGGLTWIYDQGHDRVVKVPNPAPREYSTSPLPLTVGTAITDHYARFKSPRPNSTTGWIFRWDDSTQAWVYVVDDPPGARITQIARSEAYDSKIGWIGPSDVWAIDNFGYLYYLVKTDIPR